MNAALFHKPGPIRYALLNTVCSDGESTAGEHHLKLAKLYNWVALKHYRQLIRKTGEPYFSHLKAVADMAGPAVFMGYEIGLCHDLLEDTDTTARQLRDALLSFGYKNAAANLITSCVVELTDVFTAAAYPGLSKSDRKKKEAARLITISPAAQTVKYADLIYNIDWVLMYDQKHAERYLNKKQQLLTALDKGERGLHEQALNLVQQGLSIFNER